MGQTRSSGWCVGRVEVGAVGEDVSGVGLVVNLGGRFEDLGIVGSQTCVGQEVDQRGGAGRSSEGHSAVLQPVCVGGEKPHCEPVKMMVVVATEKKGSDSASKKAESVLL